MNPDESQLLADLKVLGSSIETLAALNNVTLYPNVLQKSVQPLVKAPFIPCCYGGGTACVAQGGNGTSHHIPGYGHPIPHISELGGRPENSTKYPYKSKMEEFAATGKAAIVEALEMPKVTVSFTDNPKISPLGTPFVDYMSLKLPPRRTAAQLQYGQPVTAPGSGAGTYAGVNTGNAPFMSMDGNLVPVKGSTPLEPVGPKFGPWAGLPPNTVIAAPKEIVDVMKKSLQDSPYIPNSGFSLIHKDYVDGLLEAGWCVFVVGGAVRDALVGVVSKDVDIVTDAPFANMDNVVSKIVGGVQSNYFPYGALIQMGSDKQRALDVTCLRSANVWFTESQIVAGNIFRDTIYRDFSCNALYFDPFNETIIDPTGRGVKDSVSKLIFPSCPKGQEEEWLRNPRLGLRFFKMLYKGYKPTPEVLSLLSPTNIHTQLRTERSNRGDSYFSKIGHWMLYRQLCGDLYYGTGTSYRDSPTSVRRTYKTRLGTLKKRILENGYERVWSEWMVPMFSKHAEVE